MNLSHSQRPAGTTEDRQDTERLLEENIEGILSGRIRNYTRKDKTLRSLILELPATAIEPRFDVRPGLLKKESAGEGSHRLDWEEDDRFDENSEYGKNNLCDDEYSVSDYPGFFDGKYPDSSITTPTVDVILTQIDGKWEATSPFLSKLLVKYRLNHNPVGLRENWVRIRESWISTVMLRGLDERIKNLRRLAEFIAKQQQDFFLAANYAEAQKRNLRFIPQQEAADALGLDKSSISRIIKDKWVQIEPFDNVILPLKYFFTDAPDEELLEIIWEENPEEPYVPEYIAKVLLNGCVTGKAIELRLKKLGIPASANKRKKAYQEDKVTWQNKIHLEILREGQTHSLTKQSGLYRLSNEARMAIGYIAKGRSIPQELATIVKSVEGSLDIRPLQKANKRWVENKTVLLLDLDAFLEFRATPESILDFLEKKMEKANTKQVVLTENPSAVSLAYMRPKVTECIEEGNWEELKLFLREIQPQNSS